MVPRRLGELVDAGLRIALTNPEAGSDHWLSVVESAGVSEPYRARYPEYDGERVVDFLLRDTSNPSSVLAAIDAARTNARMVRTAITRETWEAVNDAWMLSEYIRQLPELERGVATAVLRTLYEHATGEA